MDRDSTSNEEQKCCDEVSEIPLENELPSHRKSSSVYEDPSCFVTDDDTTLNRSGNGKEDGVGYNGINDEVSRGSGDDNPDGNAFSSCISSKDGEPHPDDPDPDLLSAELTKGLDNLSVTTSGSEGDHHHGENGRMEMRDDSDTDMSPLWRNQKRHIFILSEAGKPIYSRLFYTHIAVLKSI